MEKDDVLRVRVSAGVKAALVRKAKKLKKKTSDYHREIVALALSDEIQMPNGESEKVENTHKKYLRYEVRLPLDVGGIALKHARMKEMTVPRWLAALAQSNLTKEPVMTELEVVALRAVSRELNAIGRNVNQIAKALNMAIDGIERSRVGLDDIARVEKDIALTKKVVRSLIVKSQLGWGADLGNN